LAARKAILFMINPRRSIIGGLALLAASLFSGYVAIHLIVPAKYETILDIYENNLKEKAEAPNLTEADKIEIATGLKRISADRESLKKANNLSAREKGLIPGYLLLVIGLLAMPAAFGLLLGRGFGSFLGVPVSLLGIGVAFYTGITIKFLPQLPTMAFLLVSYMESRIIRKRLSKISKLSR
jgi:hypothetical protein